MLISPPGPTFRVGGGPYTVPISIINASRLSTVTLTLIYDPTKLRVRAGAGGQLHALRRRERRVHAAGAAATASTSRCARGADATGASGTGLLAAVLFDAIAPGTATLTLSGAATGPGRHGDGPAVHGR